MFMTFAASAQYSSASDSDVLAAVKIEGKWGYINKKGELKIPAIFDGAGGFTEGVAPVKVKRYWGYLNKDGNFSINPVFTSVRNFHNRRAFITFISPKDTTDVLNGYIDHRSNVIAQLNNNTTGDDFSDNRARIRSGIGGDQKFGFMDTTGKYVIASRYNYALDFSDGLAAVTFGDKWAYIDKNEKVIIAPDFDVAMPFHEGLAYVEKNRIKSFIDQTGKVIFSANDGMVDFMVYEGRVAFIKNGKMGFLDNKGKEVIAPKYDNPIHSGFKEGLAPVAVKKKDGKLVWGFIDKMGVPVVKPEFDEVQPFNFGLAIAKKDGKYGFIDNKGKWIIKPIYDDAIGFTAYY